MSKQLSKQKCCGPPKIAWDDLHDSAGHHAHVCSYYLSLMFVSFNVILPDRTVDH